MKEREFVFGECFWVRLPAQRRFVSLLGRSPFFVHIMAMTSATGTSRAELPVVEALSPMKKYIGLSPTQYEAMLSGKGTTPDP